MISLAELKLLYMNGYLRIPNFVSGKVLYTLQNEVQQLVKKNHLHAAKDEGFYRKHKAKNTTIVNPHEHCTLIDSIVQTGFFRVASRLLCEPQFRMTLLQHNSHKMKEGIPWHQDIDPSIGPGKFYNFILYPFDSCLESGGIKLVPSTHIHSALEKGSPYDNINGEVEVLPSAGELIVIDGCCFHSVPKNNSEVDRYSVVARYIERDIEMDARLNIGVYRTGAFDYSKGQEHISETRTR